MADLLVKAGRRQDADADVRAVPCEIVGLTTLREIGGDAPAIRVDPLAMALQCFRSRARDHTRTWGPKPPRQGLDSCAGARA